MGIYTRAHTRMSSNTPSQFKLKLSEYFEEPSWKKFVVAVHERFCKWCQEFGFSSHCRGYGGIECIDNELAIEVFGGDERIQSEEEIKSGLIQRERGDASDLLNYLSDVGADYIYGEDDVRYKMNYDEGGHLESITRDPVDGIEDKDLIHYKINYKQ